MSRTMPSECPHGYIYDWGDFGCDDCAYGEQHEGAGTHSLPEWCPYGCTDGLIPGTESAAQPLERGGPHVSAGAGDGLLGRLLGAPLWPSVFSEDLESACEYGPHPYHPDTRSDCLLFEPLGPIPGEPDYDENYHDQMKDERDEAA